MREERLDLPAELDELRQISFKLDQVLVLLKMSNKAELEHARSKVKGDSAAAKILELSAQPVSYSDLVREVATQTGVAEVTVRRRVAELKESGFLVSTRQGKEVHYVDSGLIT